MNLYRIIFFNHLQMGDEIYLDKIQFLDKFQTAKRCTTQLTKNKLKLPLKHLKFQNASLCRKMVLLITLTLNQQHLFTTTIQSHVSFQNIPPEISKFFVPNLWQNILFIYIRRKYLGSNVLKLKVREMSWKLGKYFTMDELSHLFCNKIHSKWSENQLAVLNSKKNRLFSCH